MTNVVFDLGGVLVHWQPQLFIQRLLGTDLEGSPLLDIFASDEWLSQDRGEITEAETFAALQLRLPEHAAQIQLIANHWRDQLVPVPETVAILESLLQAGTPVYALSNFPRQAFAWFRAQTPWLHRFTGIMVSSHVGMAKPDPAFFAHFFKHYGLDPATCVFIDDNAANVEAGRAAGMTTFGFVDAPTLRTDLQQLGLAV